jgi:hypothetical protein
MVKYSRTKSIGKRTRSKVATGRKIAADRSLMKGKKKHGVIGPKQGEYKGKRKQVQVMSHVISPRERQLLKGMPSPFEAPPENMPQSAQDYFLSSRAIARMAYDKERRILEIVFTTGKGYQFLGVPYMVWVSFQQAQSKGRFFMREIYGHWAGPKGHKTYFPNYTYREISK